MIIKRKILFLKAIFYLAEVIECGSITRAAERNGIKQANLSKIIKDLEKSLATPLFIRKGSGLIPTEVAMVLYRESLSLQKKLQSVQSLGINKKEQLPCILLYKPNSLILDFLKKVSSVRIKYLKTPNNFDIGLFYEYPKNLGNNYQIGEYDMHIGALTQQLWIACLTTNPTACTLTDFIISQLFA